MRQNRTLVISSLLTLVLLTLHLTDDIVRGISKAEPLNLIVVVFVGLLLYGTLELAQRRTGLVAMFFIGLLGAGMPYLHMRGTHYPDVVASSGGFFFLWTMFAVGGLGLYVAMVSLRELWRSTRSPS